MTTSPPHCFDLTTDQSQPPDTLLLSFGLIGWRFFYSRNHLIQHTNIDFNFINSLGEGVQAVQCKSLSALNASFFALSFDDFSSDLTESPPQLASSRIDSQKLLRCFIQALYGTTLGASALINAPF